MKRVALLLVMAALGPRIGRAQAPPADFRRALAVARAAFEYRDFDRVIDTLYPWVHPPRIVDPKEMLAARELLGISFHVVGKTAEAKEEFAQILLIEPKHQLDPVVVPPDVIVTFEDVRRSMMSRLERILEERGQAPPEDDAPKVRSEPVFVELPDPFVTFLPFGIPQFALDEPGWGSLWLGLQLAGLATNITAFTIDQGNDVDSIDSRAQAGTLQDSDDGTLKVLQFVGLGVFVASWATSILQARLIYEDRIDSLKSRALEPSPAGTVFPFLSPVRDGFSAGVRLKLP